MTPMTAEHAVTATVKLTSYPAFRMAGMMMEPSPAASAFEEPEMPAKIMLVTTLTCPRPPGRWPTMACASRRSMLVMPAQFMRLAARTKKGIASKMKEPYWIIMRWSSMMGVTCGVRMRMGTTEKASAKEIGTRKRDQDDERTEHHPEDGRGIEHQRASSTCGFGMKNSL